MFVHDLDGNEKREPKAALAALSDARSRAEAVGAPPSAVGVAVPMVEAWLLSDPKPLRARGASSPPKKPERNLRRRGSDKYAKGILERHLQQAGIEATAKGYAIIAEALDLDAVARACPIGFAPFLAELHALRDQLS